MLSARSILIGINPHEFLMITARRTSLEVAWLCGLKAPLARHIIPQPPMLLGLHDGMSWQLEALRAFIRCFCPVDWQPLRPHQHYCSDKCKQRAYRERKKVTEQTHISTNPKTGAEMLVLIPQNDPAARLAIKAYAKAVEYDNPLMADHLREWLGDLSELEQLEVIVNESPALPDWLIEQSRIQIIDPASDNAFGSNSSE